MKKIITDIKNNIYLKEEKIKLNKIKNNIKDSVININVYKNQVISKWLGMGSAITESTAYNYLKLPNDKKKQLLNDLYSKDGLDYDFARISIASNDFSLSPYEYSKKKDLRDFSIERDKKYIIPMLKDIFNIKKLSLIASPWSPPRFMKNNIWLFYGGKLKKKYYNLYAKYLKLFIDKYKESGFNIDYITMQNEPMAKQKWESCIYSLKEQKDFIYNYLIKELDNTKVILWDHNRDDIINVTNYLYNNNSKVNCLGLHWYTGGFYNNIKTIHNNYPNLLIFNTEMCSGFSFYNEKEWINDAELYLKDIISCMNSGVSAYLSWNTLLDFNGGPSHKKNYVKSPIILNEKENDYIKTPIFYYLMHISKYIKNGYEIIESNRVAEDLYVVAAKKNDTVITILNSSDNDKEYNILIDKEYVKDKIKAHSIVTYIE